MIPASAAVLSSISTDPRKDLLSRKEAARYLTLLGYPIAVQTLANMASSGYARARKGPPYMRYGWTKIYYQRADLDEWAKKQVVWINR